MSRDQNSNVNDINITDSRVENCEVEYAYGMVMDVESALVHCINLAALCWAIGSRTSLTMGRCLKKKNEARKLGIKATWYVLFKKKHYRRSFFGPLLRCIHTKEIKHVLCEFQESHCENHSNRRSLAHKALNQRYYWLTMQKDAIMYAMKMRLVPKVSNLGHRPPKNLISITALWPFMQWGMNIIGPLPNDKAGKK